MTEFNKDIFRASDILVSQMTIGDWSLIRYRFTSGLRGSLIPDLGMRVDRVRDRLLENIKQGHSDAKDKAGEEIVRLLKAALLEDPESENALREAIRRVIQPPHIVTSGEIELVRDRHPVVIADKGAISTSIGDIYLIGIPGNQTGASSDESDRRHSRSHRFAGSSGIDRSLSSDSDAGWAEVTIYLSEEDGHAAVELAVEEWLRASGIEVAEKDDPVIGSWFRRMRGKVRALSASPLAAEGRTVAIHTAEVQLQAKDSTIASELLQGVAPVLAALESTSEAVIRAQNVLIVKVNSSFAVHQLTPAQQQELNRRPDLAMMPKEILLVLGIPQSPPLEP